MQIPALRGKKSVHFTGIGGIGMSSLAQLARSCGLAVTGSDRANDKGRDQWLYEKLARQGIELFLQTEGGIRTTPDCFVVSRAIEENNTDLRAARDQELPVLKMSDVLASLVNGRPSVGVSGSCGKSTTTAMITLILEQAGFDPTGVLGAVAKRYTSDDCVGNLRFGQGEHVVAEVDESDGSVRDFHPEVAVLTNISKDHFETDCLEKFFRAFLDGARQVVLNADCELSSVLLEEFKGRAVTFGLQGAVRPEQLALECRSSRFKVDSLPFIIPVPGRHNVQNALCAIAAARCFDIPDEFSQKALAEYEGLQRRWDLAGSPRGIDVIDDFAHSPAKIECALATAHLARGNVHAVFQPHGYGPTRFLWNEYLNVFSTTLGDQDCLYLLDIFDAGGTADRTISSDDLAGSLRKNISRIERPSDRHSLVDLIRGRASPGDLILVMGARDNSLTDLTREIAQALTHE